LVSKPSFKTEGNGRGRSDWGGAHDEFGQGLISFARLKKKWAKQEKKKTRSAERTGPWTKQALVTKIERSLVGEKHRKDEKLRRACMTIQGPALKGQEKGIID